jgi:hypothetical protein
MSEKLFMDELTDLGASSILRENTREVGAIPYRVTFKFEGGIVVTVRMVFEDWQAPTSDVVITNMTTLPVTEVGKGYGSIALTNILLWTRHCNLKEMRATQVQKLSTTFWEKHGFVKAPEPNPTNDYILSFHG